MATAAYLYGREEAGGDAGLMPTNGAELAEMLASDVGIQGQLDEIRSVAEEVVGQVADVLCYAVGKADAVDLLSQWEGFGRFSRSRLGLEPSAAVAAFGLGTFDVPAEMKAACAGATADDDDAAYWAQQWSRG